MISRRNFITIFIMMVVIFFLFMFTGAAKIVFSKYRTNEYIPTFVPVEDSDAEIEKLREGDVLYLGEDEEILTYVSEWCRYYRRNLCQISADEPFEGELSDVSFLIVDGASVTEDEIELITDANKKGCMVCFATVPSTDFLREHTDLAQLMGIRTIQRDTTKLVGIHLYSGFLLGGEVVYLPSDERAMKYQDMNLDVPWFVLESASKVYMSGVLNQAYEETDSTYVPPILWRYNTGTGYVFAVNSDYMKSLSALGIYTAMEGSVQDTYVYPVINSQNIVFVNYPSFAEENAEEIQELYSRKPMNFLQSLVLPIVAKVTSSNHLTPSFMISSKLDYGSSGEMKSDYYDTFFESIRECHGEVGLDFVPYKNATLEEKIKVDMDYFRNFEEYHYYSAYIGNMDRKEAKDAALNVNEEIATLICDYSDEDGLISSKDNYIYLSPTTSSQYYTYGKDFTMRSVETALGYSMSLQDMSGCLYPKSKKDHMQVFAEYFAGCIDTLYKNFDKFQATSITECSNRVREFLVLDYEIKMSDDQKKMVIETNSYGMKQSFILRLKNQRIKKISEGTFTKLEDDVYLVSFDTSSTEITLEENKHSLLKFFE